MILKSQALELFNFLAHPEEKLYERAARFQYKALKGVLEGKGDFDQEKENVFYYFPDVAAALGKQMLKHVGMSESLRQNPMAAMRLLLTDYEGLNKVLEPIVLSSAESTYYFLKEATKQKIELAQSQETYYAVLLSDPIWMTRLYADTKDEQVISLCLGLAEDPSVSVGAAYLHLFFNSEADPNDFADILSTNPMYAYLASRQFYSRGLELSFMKIRNLNSRWAYHFITDGFLDNEEGLVDAMLPSPEWLVEYLVESERFKDISYTTAIIERALTASKPSIIGMHLQQWLERSNKEAAAIAAAEKAKESTKETK